MGDFASFKENRKSVVDKMLRNGLQLFSSINFEAVLPIKLIFVFLLALCVCVCGWVGGGVCVWWGVSGVRVCGVRVVWVWVWVFCFVLFCFHEIIMVNKIV